MCDFLSFFVHRNADKIRALDKRYAIGDLNSHSESATLAGIKYGHDGDEWAEAEWTADDDGASLVVRDSRADVLRAVILGDFKTRPAAIKYAIEHVPSGLTTLDLSSLKTLDQATEFPSGLETLYLSSLTTLDPATKFPNGCMVYR